MAFWDHVVDSFLKLFVPCTHAHSTIHFISREGGGEQVAKFIIPHRAQTNVLHSGTRRKGVVCQVLPNMFVVLICSEY